MSASPNPSGSSHGADHGNPIPKYIAVFFALLIATGIEALPLFGLVDIPPAPLLGLSAVKFVVVVLIFMHMLGDHPMFWRVFFFPLGMAMGSFMVLMTLSGTWQLTWQEGKNGRDLDEVAACYRSRYDGACGSWVKSPVTGNEYCSAPASLKDDACQKLTPRMATDAAFAALLKPVGADPRFEGFADKAADAKLLVLMEVGKEVYGGNCAACHGPEGAGVAGLAPPMAGDAVANGASEEHINVLLKGLQGKVINGQSYAGAMPPWKQLSDDHIASVITWERQSWGNKGDMVLPEQVAAKR